MTVMCLWAKFMKKLRGSAIVASQIDPTSKVEAGSPGRSRIVAP